MDAPDLVITIDDVRTAGYCTRGAKKWFDGYGLDFRDFLENGIPADRFLATGCAMAHDTVRKKLEREKQT